MDLTALVERVASFDAACRDRDEILSVARDVARLRRWLDGRDAAVTGALSRVSSYPEKSLADATRVPLRQVERSKERADLAAAAPCFADALEEGTIDGGHLDAFNRAVRGLDPTQRQAVLDDAERLVGMAEHVDADEFAKTVKTATDRVRAESGMDTLERQRRDMRLRSWVDKSTGMWRLSGAFDPLTGMRLAARLNAAKEELFRTAQPDTCPDDPIERDQHLAAHALAALVLPADTATVQGPTRPEFVALIDATQPPDPNGPVVDWGLPVELPPEILAMLAADADVHEIVLWNGLVVHAPGTLDLGRTTRIANRAQRRVLRAWYATCALPGCTVRYDNCRIHHITWWRHGGRTDLTNLLPVCTHHHTKIHNSGWAIELDADRTLRIRLPDGQVLTTGPPARGRKAA